MQEVDGDKPSKRRFKTYALGYLHIDIAEVQTAEGKLDTSKNLARFRLM